METIENTAAWAAVRIDGTRKWIDITSISYISKNDARKRAYENDSTAKYVCDPIVDIIPVEICPLKG